MRCTATAVRTGERCGRTAQPGSRYCHYHRGDGQDKPESEDSRRSGLPREDPPVPETADPRGMDGEIVLLRKRIREAADEGDWEAMRKGIETLCKVLKVQYVLEGRSAESLAGSLSRVLEEVGNELGMTL
jgi:hypothetical protein